MGLEQHNDVIYHLKGQITQMKPWKLSSFSHPEFLSIDENKTKIHFVKCVTKQLLVPNDTYNMFFHTVDVNGDQQLEGE